MDSSSPIVDQEAHSAIRRPVPVPDPDSQPYWDALREHRLVIQQCCECSLQRFPPIGACHRCHSWSFRWLEVDRGVLNSWTTVTHGVIDALREQTPYVVGLIDVGLDNDEPVFLPANVVGVRPEDLSGDMALVVRFQDIEGGYTIPVFATGGADASST
jgi:uncharacterized OB-fold protein